MTPAASSYLPNSEREGQPRDGGLGQAGEVGDLQVAQQLEVDLEGPQDRQAACQRIVEARVFILGLDLDAFGIVRLDDLVFSTGTTQGLSPPGAGAESRRGRGRF